MARMYLYRNYRFIDKDLICDALRTMIRDKEHLKNNHVQQITGVSAATIDGWLDGATRRPQNATITQVSAALGYVRHDEMLKDGSVIPGFSKARTYDYKREREKQADFFLKTHKPKKKKPKAKKNGHG